MKYQKNILNCIWQSIVDTIDHDGIEHAGYLAFVGILGVFPFLVIMFAIAGMVGQTEIGLQFVDAILQSEILPENVLKALNPRIDEIISGPPQGILTLAVIGALWTASSAVEGLKIILNRTYRVSTPPAYIWRRLMSIIEFLLLTFLAMFATSIFIIIPSLYNPFRDLLNLDDITLNPIWHYLRYGITTTILLLSVMIFYYVLPNIKQRFMSVFPGAVVVVILWFVSGYLFSLFLANFEQIATIYGSLAGIISALLFFYICSLIIIFGGELNYHLDCYFGNKIEEKIEAKEDKKL